MRHPAEHSLKVVNAVNSLMHSGTLGVWLHPKMHECLLLFFASDLRVRNPERTKILYLSPPERTEDGMMEEE